MRKLRAIVKRSDEDYGHMTNISASLENLQKIVGGYIEMVSLPSVAPGLVIICNEEGKIKELPFNMRIPGDVLVGDIIVIGTKGEELDDIPIEFARWKEFCRRLV